MIQVKEPLAVLNIKSWAEEDRPREKFLIKGASSLSDAELIAILIGSGTPTMSAVDLSKLILKSSDNDLNKIAKLTIKDLTKFKGMGEAKAISIAAALELGRRRNYSIIEEKPKLKSSKMMYQYLAPQFLDLLHEECWLLMLDSQLQPIKKVQISKGGVMGTVVDVKIILKHAIENLCQSIVLYHNHPSGNLLPSNKDIKLTDQLRDASKLIEVTLIDHLIFTNNGYYSFTDGVAYTN